MGSRRSRSMHFRPTATTVSIPGLVAVSTSGDVCPCTDFIAIASCEANSDFELAVTGGDGSEVQYCKPCASILSASSLTVFADYIGFSPSLNSIIVTHQGTDPTKLCVQLFRKYYASVLTLVSERPTSPM